jgi:hypothetical protein
VGYIAKEKGKFVAILTLGGFPLQSGIDIVEFSGYRRRGSKVAIISLFWVHLYHKYAFISVIPPCCEIVGISGAEIKLERG